MTEQMIELERVKTPQAVQAPAAGGPVRLNLGGGDHEIPGFVNVDRKTGGEVFPLAYPDNSVDEIRASHILEHFSHCYTINVLQDWVRALKPGGLMRIAVPDFDWIISKYDSHESSEVPIESFIMGSQGSAEDHHKAIFTRDKLKRAMGAAGLSDIDVWESEITDCATLDVSLNLQGRKPEDDGPGIEETPKVTNAADAGRQIYQAPAWRHNILGLNIEGLMSVPRLGWTDMHDCMMNAVTRLGINVETVQGAYWMQCLHDGLERKVDDGVEVALVIDYDSIFNSDDIAELARLMREKPHIDALCGLQMKRGSEYAIMSQRDNVGNLIGSVPVADRERELMPAYTAHFGLTMIRMSSLKRMSKPWLCHLPSDEGSWAKCTNKTDADIYFWKKWAETKNNLFVANRVPIGHLELMVTWPSKLMKPIYQPVNDWREQGRPWEVMR